MLTVDANVWVAAFDPGDAFHVASVAFLQAAIARGQRLAGPAFLPVEAGCAVARRAADVDLGRRASEALLANPVLALEPMTAELLHDAVRIGTAARLRAADALYAAVAERTATPLITWDKELVQRAGALTPATWMTQQALQR